ncbi:hypothetical protein B0H14DRAFT_3755542 [Mycena olivaceomarginata]|nr:hypothetical protein B0H14DRAFT_3755542 [Mycena olivaceomarginata]
MARRYIPPSATPAPTNYSHAHRSARRTRDENSDAADAKAADVPSPIHGAATPTHMAASRIRRPPHALLAFQLMRDPASPYDCARATLTGPDYQLDSIRLAPHVNVEHHAHDPSFYPAILSSPPSHSPSLAVPINPGAYVGITRPASVTTSFGMQPCRMCMLVRRDVRRCARSAHRPGAHGRFLYSSLVLHLPSLPSPLLFPAPVSLDRSADAPLPIHPRSSFLLGVLLSSAPFHSSSHPLAGNPPRKPPIRSIDSGGCPSALAWARPCSTSPALRARCTHSAGNARAPSLPYTLVALPRPRPSSLAPSAHTLLSRPLSLPASCPLLSPTRPHTPHPTRRYALEPSLSPRFLSAPSITYLHLHLQLHALPPVYLNKCR